MLRLCRRLLFFRPPLFLLPVFFFLVAVLIPLLVAKPLAPRPGLAAVAALPLLAVVLVSTRLLAVVVETFVP